MNKKSNSEFGPKPEEVGLEKKKPELVKESEIEFWQPNKPMTLEQVVAEMEKQGRRALTLEELKQVLEKDVSERIEPKDDDIVIGPEDKKVE